MDYKHYTNLITPQHRVRPKYFAWVEFLVSLFDVDIGWQISSMFETHTAVGKTLDIVGELVGSQRLFPVLQPIPGYEAQMTDDVYRRMILAKIIHNNFKGPQGDFPDLWESVFERDLIAQSHDNQDMFMDIELTGDYSPIDVELVLGGYIVPKPLGVGMRVNMSTVIPSQWYGAGARTDSSAHIEIWLPRDDPDPFLNSVYAGSIVGAVAGTMTIKYGQETLPAFQNIIYCGASPPCISSTTTITTHPEKDAPPLTRTTLHVGASPPIVSGHIYIRAALPSLGVSAQSTLYAGSIYATNSAAITVRSADVIHTP